MHSSDSSILYISVWILVVCEITNNRLVKTIFKGHFCHYNAQYFYSWKSEDAILNFKKFSTKLNSRIWNFSYFFYKPDCGSIPHQPDV